MKGEIDTFGRQLIRFSLFVLTLCFITLLSGEDGELGLQGETGLSRKGL